jgi:2,5-diamino-6-(ribosylamino)-4(3H)-pyrimidinone 5'-phosphate reductase
VKPRIICHMLSSVNGRTDGDAVKAVTLEGEYEATSSQFRYDAWACGRVTMQEILGDDEPFVSSSNRPAGPRPVFVARKAELYAVSFDTLGKLRWTSGDVRGDHLICVVSEQAPADYLDGLREKGISYIVSGADGIDLADATEKLGQHFGIRTLLLEGGGHINGAFLQAGLIDEVSLLIVPGIDGRSSVASVFDGVDPSKSTAVPLKLKSVQQRPGDTLWLRYEVA